MSAASIAARRGRGDVLRTARAAWCVGRVLRRRAADCGLRAATTPTAVHAIAHHEPELVREVLADGGRLLAEFAGTANADGVGHLLDLGVDVGARYDGDGYFDIARDSTALHVAAWKGWPAVVTLLLARGAAVNVVDGKGRSPLALAVKACVDSVLERSPHARLGRGPASRRRVNAGVAFPVRLRRGRRPAQAASMIVTTTPGARESVATEPTL